MVCSAGDEAKHTNNLSILHEASKIIPVFFNSCNRDIVLSVRIDPPAQNQTSLTRARVP
jgi:hypothetical protein